MSKAAVLLFVNGLVPKTGTILREEILKKASYLGYSRAVARSHIDKAKKMGILYEQDAPRQGGILCSRESFKNPMANDFIKRLSDQYGPEVPKFKFCQQCKQLLLMCEAYEHLFLAVEKDLKLVPGIARRLQSKNFIKVREYLKQMLLERKRRTI